jgi:hypothetical protein
MNAQVLQLLISVAGIAVMTGLCRFLFGGRTTPLGDAGALAGRLARDIPGFRAGRAALNRDARSALIENVRDGQIYLAVVRGDDLVTRKLGPGLDIARDGTRLVLTLDDFTLPRAELELADASEWESRLKGSAA